ncbi:MAG: helix-turn-helix domain-containing protein [Rhodanobacter sp.]
MKTYDINETAEFLKVDRATALGLAGSGELPGAKVGRAWVFLESDLVDYLRAEELVGASSSIYLVFGGGSAIGPAVVGAWMSRIGPSALPLWFALAHGALAIYAFWRLRTRSREKVPDNNFRVMAQTATTALAESVQSTKGQAIHPDAPEVTPTAAP